MAIHEECGVFGVMSTQKENVAGITYYGLYALQHRGQESCGIVVNDDGVFSSYKDLGLVSEVFSKDTLSHLPEGTMAVGHVRYGTTGGTTRNNCQPIEVNHQKGKMALAHNGNLSNALELRDKLELSGAIFHTTSDTETIAYVITRERLMTPSIEEAMAKVIGGEADCAVISKSAGSFFIANGYADKIKFASGDLKTDNVALAVRKGDKEFLSKLNEGLRNFRKSQEFDRLKKTYFGEF